LKDAEDVLTPKKRIIFYTFLAMGPVAGGFVGYAGSRAIANIAPEGEQFAWIAAVLLPVSMYIVTAVHAHWRKIER